MTGNLLNFISAHLSSSQLSNENYRKQANFYIFLNFYHSSPKTGTYFILLKMDQKASIKFNSYINALLRDSQERIVSTFSVGSDSIVIFDDVTELSNPTVYDIPREIVDNLTNRFNSSSVLSYPTATFHITDDKDIKIDISLPQAEGAMTEVEYDESSRTVYVVAETTSQDHKYIWTVLLPQLDEDSIVTNEMTNSQLVIRITP